MESYFVQERHCLRLRFRGQLHLHGPLHHHRTCVGKTMQGKLFVQSSLQRYPRHSKATEVRSIRTLNIIFPFKISSSLKPLYPLMLIFVVF